MPLVEFAHDTPTQHMVQGQLAPNGIRNEQVLSAFLSCDRMAYLPENRKAQAYVDRDIRSAEGQVLMLKPLTLAHMMQAILERQHFHRIAVIGDETDYSCDILKQAGLMAENVLDIETLEGHGPWDVILVNGAVMGKPEFLYPFLKEHGCVLCVIQSAEGQMGDITLMNVKGESLIAQASAPYFEDFKPQSQFNL